MGKISEIFKSVRVIILLVFILLAIIAIHPSPDSDGIAIRGIIKNSAAEYAGMKAPKPTASPMSKEILLSIDNMPMNSINDYEAYIKKFRINDSVSVRTNRGVYKLTVLPEIEIIRLNENETKIVNETYWINETIDDEIKLVNKTREKAISVPKTKEKIIGTADTGIRVQDAPKNNIRKGLDLQGGTRVLLKPETNMDDDSMEVLLANMKERLNVFGLSDVTVRKTKDLRGNQYILVEIAGANEEEVKDLLAKQGKFEAKIGDDVAFVGGKGLTYVCRSADCSGIDPYSPCGLAADNTNVCRFRFAITLSPESAKKQAELTSVLEVLPGEGEGYLSKQLDLYLDNELVDSLNVGADLKGRDVTDIAITGSGSGQTREAAMLDALNNMKRLQTILITGSLPVKLDIIKTDAISPVLGDEFVKNALFIGALAIFAVAGVIFVRYRRFIVSVPIIITMACEVILLLGLAALIGWNLDIAAIAGIIIATGTGANDQIVIADEIMKEHSVALSWTERIKRAFYIIFGAYLTTVVAMLPLIGAGAGLLKGFAFVTIAGVSFGVFITRPAFAAVIEILIKE